MTRDRRDVGANARREHNLREGAIRGGARAHHGLQGDRYIVDMNPYKRRTGGWVGIIGFFIFPALLIGGYFLINWLGSVF